ncbi:MAG: heme exporter protein CcmB [Caldilineaceae bacterium]|nr:heme exporter protein CcmB [Caldilineaceae bacterium]
MPTNRSSDYPDDPTFVIQPVSMRTNPGLFGFWRKVWQVTAKDLRIELRAKEILVVMAAFSILAVIIFGMAFDLRVPRSVMIAPGVLWGVLLFTGLLGLNRSFSAEMDHNTLLALLLTPVDRSAIYLGKFLANLCFMTLTMLILLPVMLFVFDVNFFHPWILLTIFLGVFGYVSVGTLFAALTASIRARESMMPILLLPVLAPLFMAGLKMTEMVVDGRAITSLQNWLGMLVAFDLIFFTAAVMIFDLIWEDV